MYPRLRRGLRRAACVRFWLFNALMVGFGGCSSEMREDTESSAAVCAPGQSTACHCADGRQPSASGCDVAPNNPLGGAGATPSAGAGTGAAGAANTSGTGSRATAAVGGSPASAADSGGSPTSTVTGNGDNPTSMVAGSGGGGGTSGTNGGSGGGPSGLGGAAGAPAANGGTASVKDCGEGATAGKDKKGATKPAGTGRHSTGSVDFKVKAGNRIVRLQTTMEVPAARPKGNSTLFMWPGLEPLEGVSENFNPIGRGVLQPVLTWGSSCAPGSRAGANNYWISSMYVNVTSRERGYNGCYGGKVMDVGFGDKLYIDMRLKEGTTIWNQKVTNLSNNQSVDFDFDLKDQDQNWALFEIEIASSTLPSADVIFTDSVLTFASAEPEACTPDSFGPNDYYSAPLSSMDGTKCCLERIVLREMGVPATTMDP